MHTFGFDFLQLHFSLPRVRGEVKLYRGKVDYTQEDKHITNCIS